MTASTPSKALPRSSVSSPGSSSVMTSKLPMLDEFHVDGPRKYHTLFESVVAMVPKVNPDADASGTFLYRARRCRSALALVSWHPREDPVGLPSGPCL